MKFSGRFGQGILFGSGFFSGLGVTLKTQNAFQAHRCDVKEVSPKVSTSIDIFNLKPEFPHQVDQKILKNIKKSAQGSSVNTGSSVVVNSDKIAKYSTLFVGLLPAASVRDHWLTQGPINGLVSSKTYLPPSYHTAAVMTLNTAITRELINGMGFKDPESKLAFGISVQTLTTFISDLNTLLKKQGTSFANTPARSLLRVFYQVFQRETVYTSLITCQNEVKQCLKDNVPFVPSECALIGLTIVGAFLTFNNPAKLEACLKTKDSKKLKFSSLEKLLKKIPKMQQQFVLRLAFLGAATLTTFSVDQLFEKKSDYKS